MKDVGPRTDLSCAACGQTAPSPGTLCSPSCVRTAVHEIEELSLRRRRLAEHLEAHEDRTVLDRLDPRTRSVDGGLREEHQQVAERTNQLMAALLATDRTTLAAHADTAGA